MSNKKNKTYILAKFTAEWCKPYKAINPFFLDILTSKYDATFIKLDIDLLDEVAAKYGIAMMPTFLIFYGDEKVSEDYRGADQGRLERFISSHVRARD